MISGGLGGVNAGIQGIREKRPIPRAWLFPSEDGTLPGAPGRPFNPVWSADGKRLVYGLASGWRYGIGIVRADGFGPELLLESADPLVVHDWSADGTMLLLTMDRRSGARRDILLFRFADRALVRVTADARVNESPGFWPTR